MSNSSHLDIVSINFLKMFWVALTHRVTFAASWRLFASAVSEFFIPQFKTKFGLSRIPVVAVDHPLDDTIPFEPEYVHTYLNFYPFWIRCVYFLYKEFGKDALADVRDFMYEVSWIYYEAGKVYRCCQSTTKRPKYLKTAKFKLIHLVDPHVHCVPSLHVLLVVHTYFVIPRLIDKYAGERGSLYVQQKEYIYRTAIEITESILFMKQHSVNCIPAALFFMSKIRSDYSTEQAHAFVDDLFENNERVLETAGVIKEFIRSQYDAMMSEHIPDGGDYKNVLVDFLMSYQPVVR